MEAHHVGYMTKKLEKAREKFEGLGFVVERPVKYDELRQINIEFLVNGAYRVELIEPDSKESPFYPLMKKYKNTPYHFCYVTSDLSKEIENLEGQGYHLIDPPAVAVCIDDNDVAFLMHPNIGIIELVEIK